MTSASIIANHLRGKKSGNGWSAHCPAHNDKNPSLSISDKNGKVLVKCHAGCSQSAVIESLKNMGLWKGRRDNFEHLKKPSRKLTSVQRHGKARPELTPEDKRRMALKIWKESMPAANTPVATYMASRGLTIPLPASLRFHPVLKHFPSGKTYPGMIGLIAHGVNETHMAIQRTYLSRDGKGKAPIESNKMMLGTSRGGVIKLGEPDDLLMVGEGIETCLSAMASTGHPVWAAMSAAGLAALNLPQSVKEVIVLADGDERGETAAQKCARRWKQEGKKVSIARPPRGKDFNDLLIDSLTTKERSE